MFMLASYKFSLRGLWISMIWGKVMLTNVTLLLSSAGCLWGLPISHQALTSIAACLLYGFYRAASTGSDRLAQIIHQTSVRQCDWLRCEGRLRDDLHTTSKCRWVLDWSSDCSVSSWLSLQMIVHLKKCLFSRWGAIGCKEQKQLLNQSPGLKSRGIIQQHCELTLSGRGL